MIFLCTLMPSGRCRSFNDCIHNSLTVVELSLNTGESNIHYINTYKHTQYILTYVCKTFTIMSNY